MRTEITLLILVIRWTWWVIVVIEKTFGWHVKAQPSNRRTGFRRTDLCLTMNLKQTKNISFDVQNFQTVPQIQRYVESGKNPDARKTIFSIWRTHVRLLRGQEANHRSLNRAPLSSPYPGQWRPRNLKSPMEDNLQRRTRAGLTSLPSPLATTIRRRSLGT